MEHRRNLPLAIQANDLNNLKINGRLSTQCRAPHCANASRTAIQITRRELSVGPVDVVRPWLRSERAAASGRRFVVLNVAYVGGSRRSACVSMKINRLGLNGVHQFYAVAERIGNRRIKYRGL
jgi:hypothetical protein